jgi:hypothetical protein
VRSTARQNADLPRAREQGERKVGKQANAFFPRIIRDFDHTMRAKGGGTLERSQAVAMRTLAVSVVAALIAVTATQIGRAADDKQLQRLKGTVGYQRDANTTFTPVVGKFLLNDDWLALTRGNSAAVLALPDSSLVALGQNTSVQVGAFNASANGPGRRSR